MNLIKKSDIKPIKVELPKHWILVEAAKRDQEMKKIYPDYPLIFKGNKVTDKNTDNHNI